MPMTRMTKPITAATSARWRMQNFLAHIRRQVRNLGVAAQLQRAQICNDGPAVARGYLGRIAEHGTEAVGDDVIDIAVGHLAQAIQVIGGRMLHAAHRYHPVAITLKAVAGLAENLVTVFAAV